jgi:hypothetical protein
MKLSDIVDGGVSIAPDFLRQEKPTKLLGFRIVQNWRSPKPCNGDQIAAKAPTPETWPSG